MIDIREIERLTQAPILPYYMDSLKDLKAILKTRPALCLKHRHSEGNGAQHGADNFASDRLALRAQGLCYYYGYGVERSYVKASEFFYRGCKQKDPEAMNLLAILYSNAQGLPYRPQRACAIFRYAARLGSTRAAINLALLYQNLLGVENKEEPEKYCQRELPRKDLYRYAAQRGNLDAVCELAEFYQEQTDMPHEEATKRAKELLQYAAKGGNSQALWLLSGLRIPHFSSRSEQIKTLIQLDRAVNMGNATARYVLAHVHRVRQEYDEARLQLLAAANEDEPHALKELAELILQDKDDPDQRRHAQKCWRRAARLAEEGAAAQQLMTHFAPRCDQSQKKLYDLYYMALTTRFNNAPFARTMLERLALDDQKNEKLMKLAFKALIRVALSGDAQAMYYLARERLLGEFFGDQERKPELGVIGAKCLLERYPRNKKNAQWHYEACVLLARSFWYGVHGSGYEYCSAEKYRQLADVIAQHEQFRSQLAGSETFQLCYAPKKVKEDFGMTKLPFRPTVRYYVRCQTNKLKRFFNLFRHVKRGNNSVQTV